MAKGPAAAALDEEILELERELPAGSPAERVTCASCAFFRMPTSNRAQVEKIGGAWRGECQLHPVAIPKPVDGLCGQHSLYAEMRARDTAAATVAALAPVVERGLAAIAEAVGKKH